MSGKQNKKTESPGIKPAPVVPATAAPVADSGKKKISGSLPKWTPVAILLLTALIYSRVIPNEFIKIDDGPFILRNELIRNFSWEGIKAVFTNFQNGKYQPLVNLSFLLEYRFFGFNPIAFHITNVLLHLASTWVVYRFTEQLSGKRVTAAVVSVLFAVHPMHVEEVVWAAERKDVLYALFYLLAMLYYLKYLRSGLQWKHFIVVFLLFLASEFSKSTAMTLPLALLAIDLYKGRKLDKRAWLEKLPMVLVAVVFAVLASLSSDGNPPFPESINLINRVFLDLYVPVFYIVMLFFPFGLSTMHYYPAVTDGLMPWQYYAAFPLLAFIILFIVWLIKKRSPYRREVLFGVAFFAITIAVMEQITGVGPSVTPERYTYIPYIGLFYIIGQWLSNRHASSQKNRVIAFTVFLVVCCAQTWARIGVWKNSDDIFTDIIEKNEKGTSTYDFYFMRGDKYAYEGKLQEALQDYNQSISINPGYAEVYTNRGAIYFQIGDTQSALHDYNTAIALKPELASTYADRAALEASGGSFESALKDYDHFLKLDSNDTRGYSDRGMVRLSLGDTVGACNDWERSKALGNKDVQELIDHICH